MSNKRLLAALWSVAGLLALAAFFATRSEVIDYREAYQSPDRSARTSAAPARVAETPLPSAPVKPVADQVSRDMSAKAAPMPAAPIVASTAQVRSAAPLLGKLPPASPASRPVLPLFAKAGYVRATSASPELRKQAAAASRVPDDVHFASACKHDHDLHLAASGPGLYVCASLNAQVGPDTDDFTEVASFPNTETFKLHSRPGARLIVFLDFNGHTTSGTPWNAAGTSFTTPPYTIDADTTTFNDQEHTVIQSVWKRMAEDFAPYDVDVTTEDPSNAQLLRTSETDRAYGMRVVFGPDQMATGAGGVAFLSSFDAVRDKDPVPCFVFAGQGQSSIKFLSEAGSHEVGHTVGLYHDGLADGEAEYYVGHGSGAQEWAPIMGVGYYRDVVQWSKGDYDNASQKQDDLEVIRGFIPFITDDHGDTIDKATAVADNSLDAGGIIRRGGDLDLFKIGCGRGPVNITSKVTNQSPNLRMKLELLDGDGAVVATQTALGTSGNMAPAVLTYNVATKGYYYLRVSSVGSGDADTGYTDYASAGYYGMTGSWNVYIPGNEPPVADATGTGPTIVTLNSAGLPHGAQPSVSFRGLDSLDPDGSIVNYRWDFGDESGAFATGALASYAYRKPGSYNARLTVTDNQGASSSVVVPVTVNWPVATPLPTPISCVATVSAVVNRATNNTYSWQADVRAVDEFGAPVNDAEVTVAWSGALRGGAVVRTNAQGRAYFDAGRHQSGVRGSVVFTVVEVKKPVKPYAPGLNAETSATATR